MRRASVYALLLTLAVGWLLAGLFVDGPPARARVLLAAVIGASVFLAGSALVTAYRRRRR